MVENYENYFGFRKVDKMDDVIIKENKIQAIKSIIFGIVFLCGSIYAFVGGLLYKELFYIITGAIGSVFFGAALIITVKRALNQMPLLSIGKDGITDMSTAFSVGFIDWQEIQSINVEKIFGQEYIVITVYDLSKIMKRISSAKQVTLKASIIFKSPPVTISLLTADIEINEVVSMLKMRLEEYRTNI